MIATYNDHTAGVQLLVGAGADKDAKNNVRECERVHLLKSTCQEED